MVMILWGKGNSLRFFKYLNIFQNVLYSCDGKAEFSASVFSVTWSFWNHYDKYADLLLKKHFWLLSMLKTVVMCNVFMETVIVWSVWYILSE